MTPLISVVIPTHNRAKLLTDAIGSVRTAADNVEIVVVDDGSNDNTAAICAGIPGIVYLRNNHRLGASAARNAGVQFSSGAFVNFLDDDDLLCEGALTKKLARLVASPEAALCYGPILIGDENAVPTADIFPQNFAPDELPEGDIYFQLLQRNLIMVHAALVRKKCIIEAGLLNTTIHRGEDWDLWVRIALNHPVVAIQEPVGIARMHSSNAGRLSGNRRLMHLSTAKLHKSLVRCASEYKLPRFRRRQVRRLFLAGATQDLASDAVSMWKAGNLMRSLDYAFGALQLHPWLGAKALWHRFRNLVLS
jgi:glycosyltransferase involved in cell wall biosynthesis